MGSPGATVRVRGDWRALAATALCLFAATRVEGGSVGVSGQFGYWNANTSDPNVETVFGGSPTAIGAGVALHWAVTPGMNVIVSLDGLQGSTEKAFRPRSTPPDFVVDESVWLRMVDLLAGLRFQTSDRTSARFYAALLGGPTLIDQRLREVAFTDPFTPDPSREWKATIEVLTGVEFRAGRLHVGPEAVWRHMVGDITLAQLRGQPQPLDGWGVRLRVRVGR
jgi:hypothetical protein